MAQALIEAGADVNKGDVSDGYAPVHIAASLCEVEVVQVLIAAGADLNKVNTTYDMTPLYSAANLGDEELTRALIAAERAEDTMTGEAPAPLCCANPSNANAYHFEVAKLLVAAGATKD